LVSHGAPPAAPAASTERRSPALCVNWRPVTVLFCAPRRAGDGGPVCLVYLVVGSRRAVGVQMPELPTGTVTFLFTDLEGSTRLWQEHPEAMKVAAARHDELLRDAIERHSGYVVKTTGDGFHAAFGAAHDAVDAAVAGQLAMRGEPWGATGPLAVRMGVHTGPAELRDGDYYGTAVNRAARLMSVAHGGQIVVSLASEELVQESGVELLDLGEHVLKDLSRAERVFQVVHRELCSDFPVLRSLDAFPGNLPAQVTSFVGRDDDMAQIVEMLAEGAALVTLIGTGGVGKTRLAVQVAAEVLAQFGDGAWFCDLASARDGDAMAQVVATALGCAQRAGLSLAESIVEYAKVRELLVVLDNCEHLLDEAGALAEALIQGCPGGRLVATSREAFGVRGERVVRVRSLDAPDPSVTGADLLESAAVRLFADRAADAGADTTWNDVQWAAVGEICRRVDGIPLAIELAAARVLSMRPTEIAAHLDERFRLLTGTRRGRVERHQTLRSTVEWSYQLLEADDRAVFDRLGVFAGTFDTAGASAVASDDDLDTWQVVDSIASLVAKSMLVVEDGPDETTSYAMLETLRQFGRERLEEAGDADRWRRRHAEYYVTFAEAAGPALRGPDEVVWMARLVSELDNLRTAVGWSLDRDGPAERELAVRIVASFSFTTMSLPAIGALAGQAAGAAQHCRAELRSHVLGLGAHYEMQRGNAGRARALAEDALRDGVVAASANPFMPYQALGFIEMAVGNAQRALEIYRDVQASFAVDDPWGRAHHLAGLASWEAMAGQLDEARADAESVLEMARRLQNPSLLHDAFHAMTWAYQRDEPAVALAAAEQGIELYRAGLAKGGTAAGLVAMAGGLRFRMGDPNGALELLREAVLAARDLGGRPQLSATLDWSLGPLVKIGRPEPAATLVGALTRGALADVGNFPLVAGGRARTLERVRVELGNDSTDRLVAQGAAMTYDEIINYALQHLEPT
jgi:predicted ATPase/class 3 adenylate cyclase/tetratricopeptide (TPR) repeat protein